MKSQHFLLNFLPHALLDISISLNFQIALNCRLQTFDILYIELAFKASVILKKTVLMIINR